MGAGWARVPSLELSHTSTTMSARGLASGALSEGAGVSCEGALTRPSMAEEHASCSERTWGKRVYAVYGFTVSVADSYGAVFSSLIEV